MHLDSAEPSIPYREFVMSETRFNLLWQSDPDSAESFLQQAQQDVMHRYNYYKQLSELNWSESISPAALKAQVTANLPLSEAHHE